MSKRQQLCLIAILLPLIFFSGLPSFWKGIVFILMALYLIVFAYRTTIEPVMQSLDEVETPAAEVTEQQLRPDGTA